MSGNVLTGFSMSMTPLPAAFRFAPRPNRAHLIQWRPWHPSTFMAAIHEDKPVFLLITNSWSRWSHIMDETTLSEPNVIAILNQDFISIRVDSDLRPDVNQRYNQNGWPSVVLLSSEGEILWGGVFVAPKEMLYYLGHVRSYYRQHHQELTEQVQLLQEQRVTRRLTQTLPTSGVRPLLQEEQNALEVLPGEAGNVLRDLYDVENGGFTIHPHLKFPHADALELLLLLSRQRPDALDMVCYSLEQMYEGGLWDKEEGGFFRYSAASDWSMPHTEKMLEENAALLQVVLHTAEITGNSTWTDLAQQLIHFVNTTLWQPGNWVFSGSQSADEEYYEPGLYSRASRVAPYVDTTIYTAWNARMISAYLLAAQVLGSSDCPEKALRALDTLYKHMLHREGSMYHSSFQGHLDLPGQLTDQVWMTRALLDAYELTAQKSYLEAAINLMHFACRELLDTDSGLFYDYPESEHLVGRLLLREQPLVENAIAAECLLRMAVYSKRQNLRDTGLLVLSGCKEKYRRTGIQGAMYACIVAQARERGWI